MQYHADSHPKILITHFKKFYLLIGIANSYFFFFFFCASKYY